MPYQHARISMGEIFFLYIFRRGLIIQYWKQWAEKEKTNKDSMVYFQDIKYNKSLYSLHKWTI